MTTRGAQRAGSPGWLLQQSGDVPVLTSAAAAGTVDLEDFLPSPQRRGVRLRRLWLFLVTVVALALVAGLAGGALIRRALDSRGAQPSTSVVMTPTATTTAVQPWTGDTTTLPPLVVNASCVAPAGVDAAGDYVTYDPAHLLDEQATTAWRCNGDGVNQTLDFTFGPGAELVGVGVLNGYSKSAGETSFYDQYRRVVSVRWDLPDGSWFIQNLSENNSSVQQLMIPPTDVEGNVRLTILSSTTPGQRGDPSRDAVLISTVNFLTRA
ncbi:NADase-type glycan-binding domain-containing protein [Propionibacteriaceae bacterium Y1923]